MLSFCISTHNNLPYLQLAVDSVRKYSYYKDAPFIIHAENCTDGTNEWLLANRDKYNLTLIVEPENTQVRGIGGGMNICADQVETTYICFLHSDMVVSRNWDKSLTDYATSHPRTWVDSFRIEPDIFNSPPARKATVVVPLDTFGHVHSNFDNEYFQQYAAEFVTYNASITYPVIQGVSGLIEKGVWCEVGGNDSRFAPASWEDLDLFLRMQRLGVGYVSVASSLVYHFGARGSHFPSDDFSKSSDRQRHSEQVNIRKWLDKWGKMPTFNEYGMIVGLQ